MSFSAPPKSSSLVILIVASGLLAPVARAAAPQPGPPLTIARARGVITVDGDLGDPGWQGVPAVTQWFETRVGDNVEPQVKNEGYLAYDDTYLYAGFRFADPDPKLIRAPIADHDQLSGNTDYAGVIVDSNNDGKTAILFLANPNGLLYDAVSNDATGEDSSPDYFWESRGKVTATGWNLEIRIPFSSLRYKKEAVSTWGIMMYRNYPRDRRYQFFTNRLPRDVSCFICNSSKLLGLADLPQGSHLVVAPYASGQRLDAPGNGLGTPMKSGDVESEFGGDLKWSPLASTAIDATINPDFSQIESDVAQITANERFAIFYPEKRPFFIEGIDLFATPFQAVYTRSVTAPTGGLRVTGRAGSSSFTALGVQDDGGGGVILPGPQGSSLVHQDYRSNVGIFRLRRDLGRSFLSLLGNARVIEDGDGGGYNAVLGPDFEWRPRTTDTFTGQALWSSTETPNRTDLTSEWDGRKLEDHALLLRGSHNTATVDLFLQGQDLGPDFRADQGFIPQVGYREGYFEGGYTVRPEKAFFNRIRTFTVNWYDEDDSGSPLNRRYSVGMGADGRWGSFTRIELNQDEIRVGNDMLSRFRPYLTVQASPSALLNAVSIEAYLGQEIDFDNAREGTGQTLIGSFTLRPNDHLELRGNASGRWLHVDDPNQGEGRLFLAQVERLRAAWSFSSRSFVRLIGQYEQTTRDTSLYTYTEVPRESRLGFSALFAYKLNWQTVFYVGYGDGREFDAVSDQLQPSARQGFVKVSYAIQR
jgi:hypothetical protein